MRTLSLPAMLTAGLLLLAPAALAAAGSQPSGTTRTEDGKLREFHAVFRLERGGHEVAEAVMSLKKVDKETYRYTSHSEALGVLSFFVKDEIDEVSVFHVNNGEIVPLSYIYRHKGSSKNRNEDLTYDWVNGIAASDYRGRESSIPLMAGTVDRFLLPLALGASQGIESLDTTVPVIDKGEVKQWHLKALRTETLQTRAGTFEALRIERVDDDTDKTVRIWLAPALNYAPIRIDYQKRGDRLLRLNLHSLK
ncbi:MAG: DUF3108 domain-containing protein [Gammaproteobacteria bacterium]|nr:DUF3108 domain-containing protein [Gammaproteobacteria bacterium]